MGIAIACCIAIQGNMATRTVNAPTAEVGTEDESSNPCPISQSVAFSGVLGDFVNVISGTFLFFAEGTGPDTYDDTD